MRIGTQVHFLPGSTHGAPTPPWRVRRCIPATVTRAWTDECVNLVVFADGTNDLDRRGNPLPISHATSVLRGPSAASVGGLRNAEWHLPDDCEEKK